MKFFDTSGHAVLKRVAVVVRFPSSTKVLGVVTPTVSKSRNAFATQVKACAERSASKRVGLQ